LLIQLLKHIEISKGAVVYKGNTAIKAKKPKMPNGGGDNQNTSHCFSKNYKFV